MQRDKYAKVIAIDGGTVAYLKGLRNSKYRDIIKRLTQLYVNLLMTFQGLI